jgi:sporulation protein YlmC with PRC-barrel domain
MSRKENAVIMERTKSFKSLLASGLLVAGMLVTACGGDEAGEATIPEEEVGIQPTTAVQEAEPEVGVGETEDVTEEEAEVAPAPGNTESEVAEAEPTEELSETDDVAAVPTEQPAEDEGIAAAPTEQPAETGEVAETEEMPQLDHSALKASALIGYDVMNMNGEDLGEIKDMLIGLDSGQIKYAVLTYGGVLDIGNKLFAIPLNAFNFDPQQNAFVLNVNEEMLENAPGFNEDNWPDTASLEWDMAERDFWQGQMTTDTEDMAQEGAATQDQAQGTTQDQGTTQQDQGVAQGTDTNQQDTAEQPQDQMAQQDDAMMNEPAIRASELLDYTIQDLQGEDLGEIEDLIVNMTNEQVDFVVVSLNDAVVEGDNFYAIRLDELEPQTEEGFFVYNQDVATLQNAPSFTQDQWNEDQVSVNVEGLGSISQ